MVKGNRTTFDKLDRVGRSALMSKIRSKNTKPEMILRKALHRDGLRYRIHRRDLPGKPDVSVLKYRLVIDVRGCFWHGHSNCINGHIPAKNTQFWKKKLEKNMERDCRNVEKLRDSGLNVFVLWECEILKESLLKERLSEIYSYLNRDFQLNLSVTREPAES